MATITAPRRGGFGSHAAGRLGSNPASPWRHLDFALVGCLAAISAIGTLMVYSSTRGPGPDSYDSSYLKKQALFVVIGFGAMVVTSIVDYRRVRDFAPLAYAAVIGSWLVLVLFYGWCYAVAARGTQRAGAADEERKPVPA